MSDTHQPKSRANRLASETSPYLLQHAHNPVDWYPWGPEALERARSEGRPIFLSIGYSACHWCHVMERESFEDPAIAALMNRLFVNVKVDREERPDLDQIYMTAVQAMTGHGGWPMSVFLTPDLKPFYGGTYFPPTDARGTPGFPRVLEGVRKAWDERRGEIEASAAELTERLHSLGNVPPAPGALDVSLLENAGRQLLRAHDGRNGGFGEAPKFPHPMDLKVLLRVHARTGDARALAAARLTLDRMARGGIHDHLGGGFARYSTDERWLVPHFEKMLYDNALLASVYVEAHQATGDSSYAQVARDTLDYLSRRMADPEGGFQATEDADSEGVEGKYYVWTLEEVRSLLGADRALVFATAYDVTEAGNWEHVNILNQRWSLAESAALLGRREDDLARELAADRATLLAAREKRVPPGKDTKVLTSWNGLAIAALADASRALREPRYLTAAERAAAFVLDRMLTPEGRLLHSYNGGQARLNAYLDDYANLIDGLVRLYEASGTPRWVEAALALSRTMIDEFSDPDGGGFFYTSKSHEALIARTKDVQDDATPSGTAMAATALLRLGALTGRAELSEAGRAALMSIRLMMDKAPMAAGQALVALDFLLGPERGFAVVAGDDRAEFVGVLEAIQSTFGPTRVVVPATAEQAAALAGVVNLLEQRPAREGRATTYICEGQTCRAPVLGVEGVSRALSAP